MNKPNIEKLLNDIKGCYWIEYGEEEEALQFIKDYDQSLRESLCEEIEKEIKEAKIQADLYGERIDQGEVIGLETALSIIKGKK